MDVQWPVVAGWSLVAAEVLALAAWWLVKRDKRKQELRAEYRNRLKDECLAFQAYERAVREGTALDAQRAAKTLSAIRESLDDLLKQIRACGAFALLAGCALLFQGCITREGPERIVKLDQHIRIVAPGETVPDYPEGQTRWWLLSPEGLVELLPQYKQAEF